MFPVCVTTVPQSYTGKNTNQNHNFFFPQMEQKYCV